MLTNRSIAARQTVDWKSSNLLVVYMRADYEYKIYLILLVPIKTFPMCHNLVAVRFDLPFWEWPEPDGFKLLICVNNILFKKT